MHGANWWTFSYYYNAGFLINTVPEKGERESQELRHRGIFFTLWGH